MTGLLPYETTLKDGTHVILQRILPTVHADSAAIAANALASCCTMPSTVASIHSLLNHEIKQGNSYPFEEALSESHFMEYFFGYDAFVLRTKAPEDGRCGVHDGLLLDDAQLVGCFYIKPNYPGRSSHLCNGGFLVAPAFRGNGAGFILGDRFRYLGQRLGYRGCVFNLVFHDNPASLRLWRRLRFTKVGELQGAGRHPLRIGRTAPEDPQHYVDATVWFHDFTQPLEPVELPWVKRSRQSRL